MRACPKCGGEFADEVQYCAVDGTRLTADDGVGRAGADGDLAPGEILGNYRIIEAIGKGGMGTVYRAEHVRLGRRVAIKVLNRKYATDPQAIRRFFREARAVNRIQHDHIVAITDFIEEPDGDNYTVMELLDGENLTSLTRREGQLPLERVLDICSQAAQTLAAVHAAGVVHRDLKPDNIFLVERDGRADFVKLLDFGVAKIFDQQTGDSMHETTAGTVLGTPAYMAPEQAVAKQVDHRADIFSLGVILYELCSGQQPYRADTLGDLVIQHLTSTPARPGHVTRTDRPIPSALERLIMLCLKRDPAKRPQTMVELVTKLDGLRSIIARSGPAATARRGPGRRLVIPLVLGLAAVAAGVTLPLLVGSGEGVDNQRPAPDAGASLVAAPTRQALDPGRSADADAGGIGAPQSALPALVEIAFDSTPPGAEVFLDGGADPLGRTPFAWKTQQADGQRTFEFRLSGFEPVLRELSLARDDRMIVTLVRRERRPEHGARADLRRRRRKRKVAPPGDRQLPDAGAPKRDQTMDPFGGKVNEEKNEEKNAEGR